MRGGDGKRNYLSAEYTNDIRSNVASAMNSRNDENTQREVIPKIRRYTVISDEALKFSLAIRHPEGTSRSDETLCSREFRRTRRGGRLFVYLFARQGEPAVAGRLFNFQRDSLIFTNAKMIDLAAVARKCARFYLHYL